MPIDAVPPSGSPESGARRPDPAAPGSLPASVRSRSVAAEPEALADRVEVSDDAIRLASGADIPSGTLSADRLAAITRRLGDGSLDTLEARETIARALSDELDG